MFSQQETRSAERIRRPAVHLLETVPGPDEEDAAVSPPALEAVDWEVLAPQGWYARIGQPIFQLLLLVATLPFVLLVAVPIALTNWVVFRDPRRILYRQPRVGHRGRIFHMYKFRTMREMPSDAFSSWRQDQDDLRVTRFGRFLRNAQLDELPQFLNILRGEMVLIGPRPEMVEIDAWARERVPGFHRRLAIKPGITGPWKPTN